MPRKAKKFLVDAIPNLHTDWLPTIPSTSNYELAFKMAFIRVS